MNPRSVQHVLFVAGVAILVAGLAAPTALSALSGSGNVNDIVQLSVVTGTLPTLTATATGGSASGSPVTSGNLAFTLDNLGSNVDTFVRYDWSASPYYGGVPAQTGITIRGVTSAISDLLWFRQAGVTSGGTVASDYFSPLVLKASGVARATFASSGNACTAWAGAPANGFTATAAGTLTFKYYAASAQTDDSPVTSDTFHYCLDTANSQAYLAKGASFTGATRVVSYGADSVSGVLNTYQYEFLSGSQGVGNKYCLVGVSGTGTGATPNLAQCQKLPFELAGVTQVKLHVLFDPPTYFPSANQGGSLTYAVAGTQWNPYASATTNPA